VRGVVLVAKKIGIAVLVLAVAVLGFIGTRPESFRIERSAVIGAPPEVVFTLIDDFHQWGRWSPWEKIDPSMQRTFEGPSAGPGARYAWAGNREIGKGRMTILESRPGELVSIRLEFFEPFAATNEARFQLAASGTGTRVGWSMEGKNGFVGKAISLFMDMDEMVGTAFEQGLADLDTAARAETQRLQEGAPGSETGLREGGAPLAARP
jgi:uncharacterized protein YndB with AHSA1/START domain